MAILSLSDSAEKEPGSLEDLKKLTSKAIVRETMNDPRESRKEYLLVQFEKAGRRATNIQKYQFWRHDNNIIEFWSNKVVDQNMNYVHVNPVEGGLVYRPEDRQYSIAIDYSGEKGLLAGVIVAN